MEFSQTCSSSPNHFVHGLSAIPIDGQTFRLVNLPRYGNMNQNSIGTHAVHHDSFSTSSALLTSSSATPPSLDSSHIQMSVPSSSASSFSKSSATDECPILPFTPPSPSTLDRLSIFEDVSPATIPTSWSLSSSVCEYRPLPVSFTSESTDNNYCPKPILSPSDYPLSSNPHFSELCQVLETELGLKTAASTKPNISSMERDLNQQLRLLEAFHPVKVSSLRSFFKHQSHIIELERSQSVYKQGRDSYYIEFLNNHFDDQLVQIINRVNKSVEHLHNFTVSVPSDSYSNTNVSIPILNNPYSAFMSPYTSTPSKQPDQVFQTSVLDQFSSSSDDNVPIPILLAQSLNSNVNVSSSSGTGVYNPVSATPSSSSPSPQIIGSLSVLLSPNLPHFPSDISPIVKTRTSVSKRAITMLNTWYSEHISHPYPTSAVMTQLAEATGISKGQVRKWFANKRCRSKNTKPLSAIACRKRLERLGHLF